MSHVLTLRKQTLWRGLGANIDFSKKPIIAIKSIFVKEYSGKLCLASHDDTQIIVEHEAGPADEKKENGSAAANGNKENGEKMKDVKPEPKKAPVKAQPKEVRNYRVWQIFIGEKAKP